MIFFIEFLDSETKGEFMKWLFLSNVDNSSTCDDIDFLLSILFSYENAWLTSDVSA